MGDIWISGAARTPIGAHGGGLAGVTAQELGSASVRGSLDRSSVDPDRIDELVFGNVLSAGLGQNVARQVSIGAGLPESVSTTSVNKVCGSGLKAVTMAAQAIGCGDADIVVAGGTESMTRAPHITPTGLESGRHAEGEAVDALIRDGLWDVYNDIHMGACGDRCAAAYSFSRKMQDDFAVASYERALAASEAGWTAAEILPVTTPEGTILEDEEPARFNEEKLRSLRPAFGASGTVTAANASSINDGAASILVLSESALSETDAPPAARILGYATAAREPEWFTLAPILALTRLMDKTRLTLEDVDLFEINEAFSCVPMAAMTELSIPHEKVNVLGGAVALGHPIGASGCRILVTLLNAMRLRSARVGVAALCIGGGEAVAIAVEHV